MAKIRQDNNVTDCIGVVYVEIGIELSRPIRQNKVYYEKKIGNPPEPSYRCNLRTI